ncbi:hypothetical protein HK104_007327 [Borealophlyctis nickersoniae]|nr:hypothetical protein HK104_007327 [Borealophlyctis nickersoniae]
MPPHDSTADVPPLPTTTPTTITMISSSPPSHGAKLDAQQTPKRTVSAPGGGNPDNNVHQLYKERTSARLQKLWRFFGDDPPLDITVKEIETQGLKAILASKVPLAYFLYSLLEDYSCENLFFYLEVEHYNSVHFPTIQHNEVAAQHIFETYLSRNSQFEVNVDERIRRDIILKMKTHNLEDLDGLFDAAKSAILVLMEGSYSKFAKGEVFVMMKKDIGEYRDPIPCRQLAER